MPRAMETQHPETIFSPSVTRSVEELKHEYDGVLRTVRQNRRNQALQILDYGSGHKGLGRLFLQHSMVPADRLDLYDPHTDIHQPASSDINVRIVSAADVAASGPYDIVSMSFVLCCLEPNERHTVLTDLRTSQPGAHLLVLDYILKAHDRSIAVQHLTRGTGKHHELLNQDPAFVDRHTEMDLSGLCDLLEVHRWQVYHIAQVQDHMALLACKVGS